MRNRAELMAALIAGTMSAAMSPEDAERLIGSIESSAVESWKAANGHAPATLAQLKSEFPGAENAEFRESCQEGTLSLVAARAAFAKKSNDDATVLRTELDAMTAERDAAKAEAEKSANIAASLTAKGVSAGVPPVGHRESGTAAGTAEAEFKALVAAVRAEQPGMSLQHCSTEAVRRNPDLHKRYVKESAESLRQLAVRKGAIRQG